MPRHLARTSYYDEGIGPGARTPGTISAPLLLPGWRNGRRSGLKIRWPYGREGSNPSLGTKVQSVADGLRSMVQHVRFGTTCDKIEGNWER